MMIHWDWVVRMVLSVLCGGLIGYERISQNKPSGVRTHAILALGAAIAMLISKYGFDGEAADRARIAAQVVSGVGFLGAGIIFMKSGTVTGLTTAAGMWATAIIGMAIGAGLYDLGIIGALLIFSIHFVIHNPRMKKLTKPYLYKDMEEE